MATEKYLKIIIDGETNFIPDNKSNRQFWAKQNTRIGNGRNSGQYLATILPATDEEVAHMTLPDIPNVVSQPTNTSSEIESLRNLVLQQQELVNKLLAKEFTALEKDADSLSGLVSAVNPDTTEVNKQVTSPSKKINDGKSDETKAKA